jgi:hypothetical protein
MARTLPWRARRSARAAARSESASPPARKRTLVLNRFLFLKRLHTMEEQAAFSHLLEEARALGVCLQQLPRLPRAGSAATEGRGGDHAPVSD